MKKTILFLLSLLIGASLKAQDNTHFDLSVSLGRGNQISKGQYETAIEQQYYDDLNKQTTFDLSLGYYFKPESSLGIEAFLDIGVGRASLSLATGQLINGALSQGALGLLLNYRVVSNKSVVILGLGIASLAYIEQASGMGTSYSIEAGTRGLPARIKYEYKLSKNIGLGVSAAAFLGAVSEYTETNDGVTTTTTLSDGEALGISRWSVTLGPRIYF